MPIKVLVNGAFGRMGQLTVKTLQNDPRFDLVGQTGREYDLSKSIRDSGAEVVVDFTTPEAVYKNISIIIDNNVHPVIGTSGLTLEQIATLQEKCAQLKLGGMVVPNFSLGAVLMMKYAQQIATYIPHVEIIEMHHENKVDSPSGTALRSADLIAKAVPTINKGAKKSKETLTGARGANDHGVPIHAIRLPGILAQQEIIFGNHGETLTLKHSSIDRQCFMPGVALACEKVVGLNRLIYGLEEVL